MADAAFELEQFVKWHGRKRLQLCLLGCEGLGDNPLCRAVNSYLATVASQLSSWALRSSRLRNVRARKKSLRI
jgi:hypothetical protein